MEVRAAKYEVSNEAKAIAEGEKATTQIGKNGKNKLEMFRFNPGKEHRIFPKQNAYYPKHCKGGKVDLSGLIGHSYFVLSAEGDKCKLIDPLKSEAKNYLNKKLRRGKDAELNEWRKNNIPEHEGLKLYDKKFYNGSITVNRKSIKDVYSHFTEPELKDLAKDVEIILGKCQFKQEAPLDQESANYMKKKSAGFESFRYYTAYHNGQKLRINTAVIEDVEKLYSLNIIK